MTTIRQSRLVTATDLLRRGDDGYRYELVHGQLIRDRPAGSRHGAIAYQLGRILGNWVHDRGAGVVFAAETGYKPRSAPDTVRAPDVSFLSQDRVPAEGLPDGYFEGPPDLAVEVLSPDDRLVDVEAKIRDYVDTGCRQVWIVAPKADTVTVYRSRKDVQILTEDDILVGTDFLQGFECALGELFS